MFSHHSQNVGSIVWTGRTNVWRPSKKFEILTWKIRLKANYLDMFSEISRSLVLPFLHPQIKFLNASFLDLSQDFITLLDSQPTTNLFLSYEVCYKRQGHGIHRRRRTAAQQYGRVNHLFCGSSNQEKPRRWSDAQTRCDREGGLQQHTTTWSGFPTSMICG